jgi:SecD/SecF fusion protein
MNSCCCLFNRNGYSVADTVIVFDRIREYLREHPLMDMKKTINDAINATLNRTVITSSTVLLVLLILFIFGGDVIRGFHLRCFLASASAPIPQFSWPHLL